MRAHRVTRCREKERNRATSKLNKITTNSRDNRDPPGPIKNKPPRPGPTYVLLDSRLPMEEFRMVKR